jgi:cephalosporin hydroxylase
MNPPYHEAEIARLCELVRGAGCQSLLEIGARRGHSFERLTSVMPAGSRATAVDMPGGLWGVKNSEPELRGKIDGLVRAGYHITLHLGDSHAPEMVETVRRLAPYDIVHIDGDHTPAGVRADWLNYGPMGKIVVFHDIVGKEGPKPDHPEEDMGVPELWRDIKREHMTAEFVLGGKTHVRLGYGVVYR